MAGEREGLIARIRQVRRAAAAAAADRQRRTAAPELPTARLEELEVRVTHLEQMIQGLQDSVHRESERHGRLITELQAQVQPSAISAALSKDARERGI